MWGLVFVCAAVCLVQHWCPEPESHPLAFQRVAAYLGNHRGSGAGNPWILLAADARAGLQA